MFLISKNVYIDQWADIVNEYNNKIKIEKKLYNNILIHHIGYMTGKSLRYITINSVNPLYVIINKINGYIEESNENKYLTLVPTDESIYILEKYEEPWTKQKNLIRSNSDIYDEKYMKNKFSSDDDLLLKKMVELRNMIVVVTSVFHKNKKYCIQVV